MEAQPVDDLVDDLSLGAEREPDEIEVLRRAYERAMSREVTPAVYTRELFETGHDAANRAAVAAVPAEELDLVGIAFRADRKTVDKVVDRLRFHS